VSDRAQLEAAAAAGIISGEQAAQLQSFLQEKPVTAPSGEEELRFIRNFHDVFLAIGICLLAIGLAVAIAVFASGAANALEGTLRAGFSAVGAAVLMWGLGELFARRRRLFLPAIAIVLSLTMFAVVAAALLYAGVLVGRDFEWGSRFGDIPQELRFGVLIAMSLAIVAPAAFYARFRLPFSLGFAGAGAAAFVIVAFLVTDTEGAFQVMPALHLVLGVLLFIAGVAFDARDPARATRMSDNGFWLHFAAAPLILNGAFGLIGMAFGETILLARLGGSVDSGAASAQAAVTLLVVIALGFLSLLINRRVLIVSASITTGIAIGILLNAVGLGAGSLAAATLITLGAFVLILGAGWHAARRALLGWVKPDGFWARVFPPETATPA
jgi:hypothetical protein